MNNDKPKKSVNDTNVKGVTRIIKDGSPYIEIGKTKDGAIYFRSLVTYDEELELDIVETIVKAMMENQNVSFIFMLSAITYISEMSGDDDAQRIVNILMEKFEMGMNFFNQKKNELQS